MVKLTKIYTRTGDEGMTGLSDFSRVRKTDPRIEAYADVDEANSAIGVAVSLAHGEFDEKTLGLLSQIQNELFDLGADLSNPLNEHYEYEPLRVDATWIDALEEAIDFYNSKLEKLDSFIIPGGSGVAAGLHLARHQRLHSGCATAVTDVNHRDPCIGLDQLHDKVRRRARAGRGMSEFIWLGLGRFE